MKAVPVAAIAATLAAGTAAYGLTNPSHPDPAKLTAALSAPMVVQAFTHSGIGKADAASGVLPPARHRAGGTKAHSPAQHASATRPATRSAARPSSSATASPALPRCLAAT